jgi:hypothetical protein
LSDNNTYFTEHGQAAKRLRSNKTTDFDYSREWAPRIRSGNTNIGGYFGAKLAQTPRQCWRLKFTLQSKFVIPNPASSGEESAFVLAQI